ncbi:DNA polymerase-like [Zingiber officinale]|uniref:DNA polymerase-like n=1 Tax=Zingiber officinale TaxID=94328 RepID=UPI001C4B828C|nr:DNA polymerase-like [Zingiber officinale]
MPPANQNSKTRGERCNGAERKTLNLVQILEFNDGELVFRRYYSSKRRDFNQSASSAPNFDYYVWYRLQSDIDSIICKQLYSGSFYVSINFKEPYPLAIDCDVLTLGFIQLLEQYVYPLDADYVKFTIGYEMQLPLSYDVSFSLGKAIPLYDNTSFITKRSVYEKVSQLVRDYAERYQSAVIKRVFIRVYYKHKETLPEFVLPGKKSSLDMITDIMNVMSHGIGSDELPEVQSFLRKKSRVPKVITSLKRKRVKCNPRPFIVADIETVLVNNVHTPYAVGYLEVYPSMDLSSIVPSSVNIFYSEDHIYAFDNIEVRSMKIIYYFISDLELAVKRKPRLRTVYFHNLSQFDGIFLLKHLVCHHKGYTLTPLMRNHKLYELKVFKGKKMIFRFRDSLTLLPGSLNALAKTFFPSLGTKGSIAHDDVKVSNLQDLREEYITYLRQDVVLLGGVMLKAQEMCLSKYNIDIENIMTLSSLSLLIYRSNYLDEKKYPIYLLNRNQDAFIRRGYYGGHSDVYKPYGENLFFYDINSLYPYVMKKYPMPCGEPVWRKNLEKVELDTLYGFIEAYVVCPKDINRPFLPYREPEINTLIFPTGHFIAVYYSEELKYARELSYKIVPLRGYMFEKTSSPFEGFITNLYESRKEAKKAGSEAMSYIYKNCMNSLYGRFGMNPESTVTEVCNEERYQELLSQDNFQSGEKLTDSHYIVNYISNSSCVSDEEWVPPRNLAVQMSAAITACARIEMYPFISKPDCYYTDTDSVVLSSPLPEDLISSSELGKFKLENKVKKGIFLAPKSSLLEIEDVTKSLILSFKYRIKIPRLLTLSAP